MQYHKFTKYLMLAIGASCLFSCSPKVDSGGFVREDDIKDKVVLGKSTRDDVLAKVGSPSSQSSFGEETWYYITARKEGYAFLKPEVVEQDVIRVVFDSGGVVSKVENYNQANAAEFDIVKRATPTEGHTMGFFEQVLGNIGRFNRPSGKDGMAGGRKPSE